MVDTPQQEHDNLLDNKRKEIRTQIRKQRQSLSDAALQAAGHSLLEHCKPFLDKANLDTVNLDTTKRDTVKKVAGYNHMFGEIPLTSVFDYCHKNSITTFLPIMRNQSLMFAPFDKNTPLKTMKYGILEPDVPEQLWIKPEQLDLVLVPLVAFDKSCNRIGMGGGFYDRSFEFRKSKQTKPTLLGVAHKLQQVEDVFAQSWDVALDAIATDSGLIPRTS